MKIRKGFVSNSSSTSFCIYGWQLKDIENNIKRIQDILDKLEARFEPADVVHICAPGWEHIVGIGEVDYVVCSSTVMDCPSELQQKCLDRFAEENDLPVPEVYSDTFRM